MLGKQFHRRRGFRHLHKAEDSLLHPCSTGCRKNNKRTTKSIRFFNSPCNFLADRLRHGPHQKTVVHDQSYHGDSSDFSFGRNYCLFQACLLLQFLYLLFIVRKIQGIPYCDILIQFLKSPRIIELFQAVISAKCRIVSAVRAYKKVLLPASAKRPSSTLFTGNKGRRDFYRRCTAHSIGKCFLL